MISGLESWTWGQKLEGNWRAGQRGEAAWMIVAPTHLHKTERHSGGSDTAWWSEHPNPFKHRPVVREKQWQNQEDRAELLHRTDWNPERKRNRGLGPRQRVSYHFFTTAFMLNLQVVQVKPSRWFVDCDCTSRTRMQAGCDREEHWIRHIFKMKCNNLWKHYRNNNYYNDIVKMCTKCFKCYYKHAERI